MKKIPPPGIGLKRKKPVSVIVKDRGVPILECDGSIKLSSFPKINESIP